MNISTLLKNAAEAGVYLYADGDELKFRLSVEHFPEDIKAQILSNKLALIDYLKAQSNQAVRPVLRAGNDQQTDYPLSFAQQRLWFFDRMEGSSIQYNMPGAIKIVGGFRTDIAEAAYRTVIARHQPLRAQFFEDPNSGEVRQRFAENFAFSLVQKDLSGHSDQQAEVIREMEQDALKPFDLSKDTLFRATYLKLSAEEGMLIFNMHHIASDGWSMPILTREFVACYQALASGQTPSLASLQVTYADYARWQREWLDEGGMQAQLDYWRETLKDLPQLHSLPLCKQRGLNQTFRGDNVAFHIEQHTSEALKAIAQRNQATLFMVLHGAFSLLIANKGESDDIAIGTPVANRVEQALTPLVGFFANTLVLRTDCSVNQSVDGYISMIKSVNLAAQSHQDIPFEKLVEELKPQRSSSYSPLFQIMFTMNTNDQGELALPGVTFKPAKAMNFTAKFDLMLTASEDEKGIQMNFEFNQDLFEKSSIQVMAEEFSRLLQRMGEAAPTADIHSLSILSNREIEYLYSTVNDNGIDHGRDFAVHHLFESAVATAPQRSALEYQQKSLTYAELNARANQLAREIRDCTILPGDHVALFVDRSIEMVIGALAIMKAGAVFVPIEGKFPDQRIQFILDNSHAKLIVSKRALAERLSSTSPVTLCLDDEQLIARCSGQDTANLVIEQLTPDAPVVMYYTSGTTGQPKGVTESHITISNLIKGQFQGSQIAGPLRSLLFAPLTFDISIQEMATAWHEAGTLVLADDKLKSQFDLLPEFMMEHAIERMFLPPSVLNWLAEKALEDSFYFDALRSVTVAGETLSISSDLADFMQQHINCELWNQYGTSETHVLCEYLVAEPQAGDFPPVGRLVPNMQGFILDRHQRLVSHGNNGELYVAGPAVGQGYHNNREITAQKYITLDIAGKGPRQLYRTGDKVRYGKDNVIHFVGRVDNQINLRGYRIEPGEVEHQLKQMEAVKKCLVIAREDSPGDKQLVAYLTVDVNRQRGENMTEEAFAMVLANALRQRLPDYMVPDHFIVLDAFPLTNNGKIDKSALPIPARNNLSGALTKPEGETALWLSQQWASLLKLSAENIGMESDFFLLGGHSLLSVRLISNVRKHFKVELDVKEIFNFSTLSKMSAHIDEQTALNTLEKKRKGKPAKRKGWL